MKVRNDDTQIFYEVKLKGKKYDVILHNFFTDGTDYTIREDFPLPGGLVHASKEKILKGVWDSTIFFWAQANRADADKYEAQEKKEMLLAAAEALETMDYEKVQKKLTREKST